jgi:hypothetical protein
MNAGKPFILKFNPDAPEKDPNYPGNPNPSDPIPVWDCTMDDNALKAYHLRLEMWLERHPEFKPEPGFS